MLKMSKHAIRYYTDKELIPNMKRNQHNYRLFDDDSINWLIIIHYLRRCDMTIDEIKHYISLCLQGRATIEERFGMLSNYKKVAEQQLQETQNRLDFLNDKLNQFQHILEEELPDNLNPVNWTNKREQFMKEIDSND